METSKITFYPVDNGGMAFIKLNDEDKTSILIDMHIRNDADNDENDEYFDVASHLRENLEINKDKIPYIDFFILTHNDDDHIKGLLNHFHLDTPDNYVDTNDKDEKKIIINETWGTSRFWKKKSDSNKLSDDAKAFNKEMKRRVSLFEEKNEIQKKGNNIKIIGIDPEGKTDNLDDIVLKINQQVEIIENKLYINILGPIEQQEEEEESDFFEPNRNSIILQLIVNESNYANKILITGDANVVVWEYMYRIYKSKELLDYDIMIAPHHCSRLSVGKVNDNSFEKSKDAINALNNSKEGAFIISSSKPIKNNDSDPPSKDAKDIYTKIVTDDHFLCTEEYPKENDVSPIIIELTSNGPKLVSAKSKSKLLKASEKATGEVYPHGK